ncbi:MAG: hypothetical protein OEV78_11240 [Spirochaetia bacterium]|nr:hypothetical protein [Spirochaetia bacterium]
MNNDIEELLNDLNRILSWCSNNNKNPSKSAVEYIAANEQIIKFFIGVFSKMNSEDRGALHKLHQELDENMILGDGSFAIDAVNQAIEQARGNPLAELEDDDMNMLIRPLAYARYCECDSSKYKLNLSPVKI